MCTLSKHEIQEEMEQEKRHPHMLDGSFVIHMLCIRVCATLIQKELLLIILMGLFLLYQGKFIIKGVGTYSSLLISAYHFSE